VIRLSALEQAELLRQGELSPVELVEAYLERIDRLDRGLGSYVTVCHAEAMSSAYAAERRLREPDPPPFLGVPVSVKDLSETRGVRTTYSCRAFASFVPTHDSTAVRRLREAGFVLLGKTNTPEFGARPVTESELNGACRNPWDRSRTAGGSSGGAAAALAACLCPASLGSDGGGSIRIPASCCGVVGLKPSRGRISTGPRGGEVLEGFATSGPLARTVADAAALLDVLAGYEPGDPYTAPPPARPFLAEVGTPPGRLRIAVSAEPPLDAAVDAACTAAVADAAALLEELGHRVEWGAPAWGADELVPAFTTVWKGSAVYFSDVADEQLEPLNRALRVAARELTSLEYLRDVQALQRYARRVVPFWDDHDVLVTPTLALPPVPIGWTFEDGDPWAEFRRGWKFAPFTQVANVTGQPALSLPLAEHGGLPIGVQLVGPPNGEDVLLRLAAQIEEARPWAREPPATA
jgi:amidase